MNDIKVSVIIPIYNTSKYIRQCLDTIIAQSLKEIEIICVDDGSTDDTPDILREYAAKDSRIKLLWQENQFAGTARNYGMTVATGKYFAFWDSDDFFEPNALELMYNQCEKDNADICICSASQFFEDIQKKYPSNSYLKKKYIPKKIPFSRKDIPDHILNFATAHPWNKLFKREFVERMKLTFHGTPNGNDIFFVINCIARADRITIVNKPLICYRVNQPRNQYGAVNKAPFNPIKNWLLTRECLIENGAYPKRSFDNKIIETLIYMLHNMRSWEAFHNTFCYIQTEVLPQMEVTMQDEGYYFHPAYPTYLEHMLNDSPEEFIVFFAHITYKNLSEKNGRFQTLAKKCKKKASALEKLREDHHAQTDELLQAKKKYKKKARALTKERAKNADLQLQLQTIQASHSYRFARMISSILQRIRKLFGHQ